MQHITTKAKDKEEEVHACLLGHCGKATYRSGFLPVDLCPTQLQNGDHAICQNYWTGTLQHVQSVNMFLMMLS